MTYYFKILSVLFFSASFSNLNATVTLPNFFSNNMVLQRGIKISVWGNASKGERVTVKLGVNSAETVTGSDGKWMVKLKSMKAGGPYTLNITGENSIEFSNVLLGDVWICAGQSNMELPVRRVKGSKKEIESANYPQIRLFTVDHSANSDSTRNNVNGEWLMCNPVTVDGFSAVGYFFGRELYKEINVPIGLIDVGWNATRIEAWTNRKALMRVEAGKKEVEAYPNNSKTSDERGMINYNAQMLEYQKAVKNGDKTQAKPNLSRPARRDPSSISSLYNYMIYPFTSYGIKGAIWYQGEANSKSKQNAVNYRQFLPAMISSWREDWRQGNFPFLFVQLPNFESELFWPEMRESMLQTYLADKNTGMAVTIDIGMEKDIHPWNKQDVGYRLSLQALDIAYKQKGIVSQGPIFKSMKIENTEAILSFNNIGSGLQSSVKELVGFKIAGVDKHFYDATASIVNGKVVVYSSFVKEPVAVRYGWENNPKCSLFNKEKLPASPFRTDNWN
jgi:sialate O-acetylesterase